MRVHLSVILALLMVCGGYGKAGEGKAPTSSGQVRGFDTKHSRQRIPMPDQRALFESEAATLSERLASAKQNRMDGGVRLTTTQRTAMESLRGLGKGNVSIHWDELLGVPVFVQGLQATGGTAGVERIVSDVQAQESAQNFLQANAQLFRIDDPSAEFRQLDLTTDDLGFTHIRYQQMYQGVEVWGRDVRVHLNREGEVESWNGRYVPTPAERVSGMQGIGIGQGRAIALERFGSGGTVTATRQVFLPDAAGHLTLCWLITVEGSLDRKKDLFVEVSSGRVVKEYSRVIMDGPAIGSGTDVKGVSRALNVYQIGAQFYMIDASKPMFNPSQSQMPNSAKGAIYTFDAQHGESNLYHITSTNQNIWGVAPGVSALFTGGKVYDYFSAVHNRNAIDNQGGTMNFVVNFATNYNNAFWNGQFMVFGNGDGSIFSDLTGAADVTAHEMTHGITEWTANLLYENQSGALNESFSDVFGTLFEFWLVGAAGNWLMGEDVFTPGTPGDALRSMSNPGGPEVPPSSRQPSSMSEYVNLPNTEAGDNGGVHVNSGIPNKAFYLFATAPGMTKENAGRVYYRALTTYLIKNSQFVDCRLAVIKAAEDLFGGAGNATALAAAAAFDAVGIMAGSGTGDPPKDPPVQGTEYLALVDVSNGRLYRWTVGTNTFAPLSSSGLSSRPAVTDNGGHLFYVDQQSNLHVVQSDGTNDQTLSSSGGFNNIAVSRSGRYLAATTVFSEPNIYVFDLDDSVGNTVLQLYTPTYHQGETAASIRYPDRIDWTSDESKIMYDAYNTTVLTGGDTLGFWDINTVRVADGSITRLFASQPLGISIGNAVFASNTDNIIALDRIDENDQVLVLAVNLNTGDVGIVTNNYSSLGSPTFSVDDKKVYYHYIDDFSGLYEVWSVGLAADGITGSGNDKIEVDGGIYPVAFATGTRPTDLPVTESTPPSYLLDQNYPNPFNPGTQIRFHIPAAGRVVLKVFDVLGREVVTLAEGSFAPGVHTVTFDATGLASGVYLSRLEAGGVVQTRRMMFMK